MPARAARRPAPSSQTVAEPAPAAVAPAPVAVASPDTPIIPAAQPSGYRGLKVWQRAMDLAAAVYRVARGMPDEVLAGELWGAAIAIPANIAAGNSLYVRADYVELLSTAHGKVARLECLLHAADRIGALPGTDTAALLASAADVGRMLRGLARALQPGAAKEREEAVN